MIPEKIQLEVDVEVKNTVKFSVVHQKMGAEIETQCAEKKFEKKVRGGEDVGKFINHKAEETLYKLNVFNFAFSLL